MFTLAAIIAAVFGLVQLKRYVTRKCQRVAMLTKVAVKKNYEEGSDAVRLAMRGALWFTKQITGLLVRV